MNGLFTVKSCLGLLLGAMSGTSLLLNVIALVSVFRLAFVLKRNQVYIISFFNILSDVLQMTLTTFYLVPSIVSSSFIVSANKKDDFTLFLGSFFMFLWYFETITQVIMALNRFVVICLQKYSVFTFTTTILIFLFLIPLCFITMYISQYANPCCSFLFDHEYLSYSYYTIEDVPNYSNDFDLPLNASSSAVSSICYILIFWTVHKTTPSYSSVSEAHKVRRARDIKYAMQFCLILIFYIITWVLFRLFPVVLHSEHVEWFVLVPVFFTINCTSNAIIYIGFNNEVQNNLRPETVRSLLYALGISQAYSATAIQPHVSMTNISSVEPPKTTMIRFTASRRIPPYRSIGLNDS